MASPSGRVDTEHLKSEMKDNSEDINDLTNAGEFSVTNPFESQHTIDSFLQPSFSPSVFTVNSPSSSELKASNGFWTIDQIAVLKPTDIDVSSLHNQQNFVRLDPASEKQAQQAIDEFFASRIEMPSPWSSERSNNHYLALISPSPAQMKKKTNVATPLTSKNGVSSSSAASSSSSSQLRVRKLALSNLKSHGESASKIRGKSGAQNRCIKETKNISTQTTLTLPKDFDLESVLAKYYTFGKVNDNTNETVGNTSLRRKLFFPDGREVDTRDKNGEVNLNALQHLDDIDGLQHIIDSPVSLQKITPVKNNLTPLNHYGGHIDRSRTPSTCHSHYSSSPVQGGGPFDARTPSSSDIKKHKFGSGVRPGRIKIGSGEDVCRMRGNVCFSSPEVSPVKGDVFAEVKGHSHLSELPGTEPIDESMSFQVCSDENKMPPESSDNNISSLIGNMESSRRQLGIEMSPIQPINYQINTKKSSSHNVESTQQSLSVPTSMNELCESPMLSPIQGKHVSKKNEDSEGSQKISVLSSTAAKPPSNLKLNHCVLTINDHHCKSRPFQNYEGMQFLCENKENIHPHITTSSSMVSLREQDVDISMNSHHTSNCQESTYNDQEIFNCDSYIETQDSSVLRNEPVSMTPETDVVTSSKHSHPLVEETSNPYSSPPLSSVPLNRLSSAMEYTMSKCNQWIDKVQNFETGARTQDSGYSTTQSNYKQLSLSTEKQGNY